MNHRHLLALLLACFPLSVLPQTLPGKTDSSGSVGDPFANKFLQYAQAAASGGGNTNIGDALKQQAQNAVSQQTQNWLHNLFSYQRGTTEISGGSYQNGIPIWNLLLVRPLYESEDNLHTTFVQGSVFRQGGQETTGNLGFGYRQLVADKKVLLGTNAFYDYEFPIGNQRTSFGLEARTTAGEINANYYAGTTGWMNSANWMQQKVMNGYDGELALAFPYIPSLQARVKTFRWNGTGGVNDAFGNTFSLTGAVWQGIYVEAGHTTLNSQNQGNVLIGAIPFVGGNFVKVSWIFGGDRSPNQKQFTLKPAAYSFDSMEERRLEKVRRENLLIKAQRAQSGFNVTVSGY